MMDLGNLKGCLNLESIVRLLENYRRKGIEVTCNYDGIPLYSSNVTMDHAFLSVYGQTPAEIEKYREERARIRKAERDEEKKYRGETTEEREERYRMMVEGSKKPGEEVEIEEATVVEGLKFILENPDLPHEKLVLGLLMLDCNFTFEDIERQFTEEERDSDLYQSLREGRLVAGAGVIANVRDTEYGRAKLKESLEGLVAVYIRKVTGDESYGNGDGAYTGGGARK